MASPDRTLPEGAIEAAEKWSFTNLESVVAIFEFAESGKRTPIEVISDGLYHHRDMFEAYEKIRVFAMLGCFEPGEFDPDESPDQGNQVLVLSEFGHGMNEAVHDLLEAKTGRRALT